MTDPIAIVGMAALFPGAVDLDAYWSNICAGVDAISDAPPSRIDPVFFDADAKGADRFYCRRGGFVDDLATFDPLAFGIMPNAVDAAEPDQLLALAAAGAALADADAVHERTDPERVAVVLGRGGYLGDGVARLDQRVRTAQQLVEALRDLVPHLDEDQLERVRAEFQDRLGPERPESSIGLVPNLAASRIANRFDLRGPAYTVDAACASSLIAVDQAVGMLRSGRADVVVAGGVHHCHDLTLWSVFTQLRALSPSGEIRPFSEAADGILVGEGTGLLVLKRWSDAERDGDRTYAVVAGTGVASDGRASSLMSPRPEGQVAAVEHAWKASGLDPARVGLVEAHGTATPVGDRTELETLRTVFGDDTGAGHVGLGSVKSMIGHAMPAAGAAGLIKAALAVHHGILPPTLHVEEPNEALAGTRFRLVTEAEPWAGAAARVAGVNAFGFGGINAHVVVTEPPGSGGAARRHRSSAAAAPPSTPSVQASGEVEPVVLLAGADAPDLIGRLDAWIERGAGVDGTLDVPQGGPARLAIVAPDARRLQLARKVLERGTPFRGRNDVWFDPDGLVAAGGKVAYLFPGVEPVFEPRVDDVGPALGLEWSGLVAGESALETQGRGIVAVGRLLADALLRIGVSPHSVAGHSLGEWTAQIVAGMIPDSYVEDFLAGLGPSGIEVSDVVFVALGCGASQAAELIAGLADAHVSHDNCPHQSVVCAPAPEAGEITSRARAAKVLAQELPFRSGFHSPLFAPYVAGLATQFGSIPLTTPSVPVWSATAVAPYPDDPEAVRELSGRHLVEPVRFRALVEQMYAEGVRAFIQVGTGSLVGFVDDTLRDHDVLTISANTAKQTGIGQLRRVAAALWSTGVDVDFAALGHEVAGRDHRVGEAAAVAPAPPLHLGSPLVRHLTPLAPPTGAAMAGGVLDDRPLPAGPAGEVLAELRRTVAEASAAARAVFDAATSAPARPTAPAPPATPAAPTPTERERVHALSVVDQPHWLDHAFYEQPEGWPCLEDLFPLVPMTAILEMLAAEAEALVPGQVVVAIEQVRAFRWLAVEPPVAVTVRAVLGDEPGLVRTSIERHARAQVRLAPTYPVAPQPAARAVRGSIPLPVPVDRIYAERHLFHGPAYQGLRDFPAFGTDGVIGRLESGAAPGALLDNAGQVFGLWFASLVDRDRLVLPTSIDRISFFGPHPQPGTMVDCVVNLTDLQDHSVRADLELTVDGTVWCRIDGWEDRRFQSDDRLFMVLRRPQERLLAEPQPGGWMLVREGWPDSASRDVVMRRYLGKAEREGYEGHNPNVQRPWLLGRIAVKDAVRRLRWEAGAGPIFPIEVHVANDRAGRPHVEVAGDDDVRVSIAHRGTLGVAIAASGVDVGIDVEVVEERPASFLGVAFTDAERQRLPEAGAARHDLEVARWWAAKEAAAKAAGTGMEGRPHHWEVTQDDGHRLLVAGRWIATTVLPSAPDEATHVVAWTEISHEDR